jgi:hypothetical protein
MRTVFLDYETVRNGDDSLDPSAIDEAVGGVEYYDDSEDAQIADRIGTAQIVLLNKVLTCSPPPTSS